MLPKHHPHHQPLLPRLPFDWNRNNSSSNNNNNENWNKNNNGQRCQKTRALNLAKRTALPTRTPKPPKKSIHRNFVGRGFGDDRSTFLDFVEGLLLSLLLCSIVCSTLLLGGSMLNIGPVYIVRDCPPPPKTRRTLSLERVFCWGGGAGLEFIKFGILNRN